MRRFETEALLPFQITIPAQESVSNWLQTVREACGTLAAHATVSPAQLQAWRATADEARWFESAVIVEGQLPASLQRWPLLYLALDTTHTTLTLHYSQPHFDHATIARLVGHLQTLLKELATEPEKPLAKTSLLTQAERRQVFVEWQGKPVSYDKSRCVHHLFGAQVQRTPNQVALAFEDDAGQWFSYTYHDLNQRADQLARYLQTLGVGPDVMVGICQERSPEMVIGILGILKAGGAYVPLDADYPKERLAFMMADAQVPVLVTEQHLLDRLPQTEAKVVCLKRDWEAIEQAPGQGPG